MNILFALFLAVTASGATPRSTQVPLSQIPAYLRPLPGATHIVAARSGNELGVSYELNVCYPAAAQLKAIAASLPARWHARAENFLNKGIPTSQVRGWQEFDDVSVKSPERVWQWLGEWQDASGRILALALVYRSPAASAPATPCNLQISATQLSAATVKSMQHSVPNPGAPPN